MLAPRYDRIFSPGCARTRKSIRPPASPSRCCFPLRPIPITAATARDLHVDQGRHALRDLDLFRPKRDAFACTLTSLDDRFSKKWERNAALPGDRIKTLRKFHDAGIFTWVSLEPTLDVKSSLALVEATHEFVDLFKVGRTNYLPMTKTTDWRDYTCVCSINSPASGHGITSKRICKSSCRRVTRTRFAFRSIISAWITAAA